MMRESEDGEARREETESAATAVIGADAAEVTAGSTTRRATAQGPRDVMQAVVRCGVVFLFGSQPAMAVMGTAFGIQLSGGSSRPCQANNLSVQGPQGALAAIKMS